MTSSTRNFANFSAPLEFKASNGDFSSVLIEYWSCSFWAILVTVCWRKPFTSSLSVLPLSFDWAKPATFLLAASSFAWLANSAIDNKTLTACLAPGIGIASARPLALVKAAAIADFLAVASPASTASAIVKRFSKDLETTSEKSDFLATSFSVTWRLFWIASTTEFSFSLSSAKVLAAVIRSLRSTSPGFTAVAAWNASKLLSNILE